MADGFGEQGAAVAAAEPDVDAVAADLAGASEPDDGKAADASAGEIE
jgi:hypothetical protein